MKSAVPVTIPTAVVKQANATKTATLETGAEIQVPLFINQDEIIKVDTRTRSYGERVK